MQNYAIVEFAVPHMALRAKRALDDVEASMRPDTSRRAEREAGCRVEQVRQQLLNHHILSQQVNQQLASQQESTCASMRVCVCQGTYLSCCISGRCWLALLWDSCCMMSIACDGATRRNVRPVDM